MGNGCSSLRVPVFNKFKFYFAKEIIKIECKNANDI